STHHEATLWRPNQGGSGFTITDLGDLDTEVVGGAHYFDYAYAINDYGLVVGSSAYADPNEINPWCVGRPGFSWTDSSGLVPISEEDSFPYCMWATDTMDVNNADQILGWALNLVGTEDAVIWPGPVLVQCAGGWGESYGGPAAPRWAMNDYAQMVY
ncbi:MAG: hypothetical protein ACPMAQ_06620, partial [Phycisphaerae bacterium]